MRQLKFRVWTERAKEMYIPDHIANDIDMGKYQVMQYTGLLDKNGTGVEVYESDIGKLGEYICKLIWDELNAQFRWIDLNTGQWIQGRPSDAEVIGNIYENEELLK